MIMSENARTHALLSFHWLKPPEASIYHAYSGFRVGTQSACGRGGEIGDWLTMDLPGDNSVCCNHCFAALTGFDPSATPTNMLAGTPHTPSTSRE